MDSLVAAFLLQQQGWDVIGIHFITGFEPPLQEGDAHAPGILNIDEKTAVLRRRFAVISDRLHIPIEIVDISREFKMTVVDYFIRSYRSGKTPNPCLVCNPSIKFTHLLDMAQKGGAEKLATGHYVQNVKDHKGRYHLFRGVDPVKDQSYFLAFLNQHQLASASFPLGDKKKADVIKLAKKEKLIPVSTLESQDICFIQDKNYGDFLSRQAGFHPRPGPITDLSGNLLGKHQGLHLFTVGQRRGINCPAPAPYYVVRIDPEENRLVVGSKDDVLSTWCRVTDINWIQPKPECETAFLTQVRYRHTAVKSRVHPSGEHTSEVTFFRKLSAVTPGQGAVFYDRDEVIGGGFIEKTG